MSQVKAFRLETLGTLRLVSSDGTVEPSLATRRRKLALLALLAVSGRPISRDRLVELFWGDHPEERARHSLSDALSHLRRVLGPDAITARRAEVGLSDDLCLALDLRELAEAARAEEWPRVLALFGGPFLDGVHIGGSADWEHWVLAQRTGSLRLFETACRAEATRLEAAADWAGLERVTLQWLTMQPNDPAAVALRRMATMQIEASRGWRESTAARAGAAVRATADAADSSGAEHTEHTEHTGRTEYTEHTENTAGSAAAVPERSEPGLSSTRPVPWWRPRRPWIRMALAAGAILVISIGAQRCRPDLDTTVPLTTRSAEARALVERATLGSDGGVSRTESIALLEQAIGLDSTFAMAYRTLALLHAGDGTRQAEVVSLLTRAAAVADVASPLERALVMSSYHLLVTGDYARAAAAQRSLIRLAPNDGDAWHDLGMTYQYLGDDARAADAYRAALDRDASSGATWANLLDALVASGDTIATEAALDSMARAIPGHPWIFLAAARVRAAQRDLPRAEHEIRAYLAATTESPRRQGIGETTLARILWSAGRLDEGDAAIRRGIAWELRLGDTVMALRESLADAMVHAWLRRDAGGADARLRRALRRFPLSAIAEEDQPLPQLATLHALVGHVEQAEAMLAAYETTVPEPIRRQHAGAVAQARTTLAIAHGNLGAARSAHAAYLATPATLRSDLLDGLHRHWVETRLAGAPSAVSAVNPSAPPATSPARADAVARR